MFEVQVGKRYRVVDYPENAGGISIAHQLKIGGIVRVLRVNNDGAIKVIGKPTEKVRKLLGVTEIEQWIAIKGLQEVQEVKWYEKLGLLRKLRSLYQRVQTN